MSSIVLIFCVLFSKYLLNADLVVQDSLCLSQVSNLSILIFSVLDIWAFQVHFIDQRRLLSNDQVV